MLAVALIALGVLCFVTGPALALIIVFAVRGSVREAAARGGRGGAARPLARAAPAITAA
ncbi:hypothetical protein ACIP5Y_03670 [Nocardia sp. NPDC088792]|uniref:hypothetical protein n=1 Tax=Nocardia sp. NPDC088792 TaxID=3364332 RepID=UPI003808FAF9